MTMTKNIFLQKPKISTKLEKMHYNRSFAEEYRYPSIPDGVHGDLTHLSAVEGTRVKTDGQPSRLHCDHAPVSPTELEGHSVFSFPQEGGCYKTETETCDMGGIPSVMPGQTHFASDKGHISSFCSHSDQEESTMVVPTLDNKHCATLTLTVHKNAHNPTMSNNSSLTEDFSRLNLGNISHITEESKHSSACSLQEPSRTNTVAESAFYLGRSCAVESGKSNSAQINNHRRTNYDADDTTIGQYGEITPDMTYHQDEDGDTLLHMAIIKDMPLLIISILRVVPLHTVLDIFNNLTQTPLHLAVITHQHQVLRMLVACGACIHAQDRNGDTPLHLACRTGCEECVLALTKPVHHAEVGPCLYPVPFQRIPQDPSILNYDGQSCVHVAANWHHLDLLGYLLSPNVGQHVNSQHGRSGRTILHEAVEKKDLETVMFLITNKEVFKLDVNMRTFDGLSALDLARESNQDQVVEVLKMVAS